MQIHILIFLVLFKKKQMKLILVIFSCTPLQANIVLLIYEEYTIFDHYIFRILTIHCVLRTYATPAFRSVTV